MPAKDVKQRFYEDVISYIIKQVCLLRVYTKSNLWNLHFRPIYNLYEFKFNSLRNERKYWRLSEYA